MHSMLLRSFLVSLCVNLVLLALAVFAFYDKESLGWGLVWLVDSAMWAMTWRHRVAIAKERR